MQLSMPKCFRLPKLASALERKPLDLSKFKPRAPAHMVEANAARVGPNDLALWQPPLAAGVMFTDCRFATLDKAVGLKLGDEEEVEAASLARFKSEFDDSKGCSVFVASYRGSKTLHVNALVGVKEYLFSNQCLIAADLLTVEGLPAKLHSTEQLFQLVKVLTIAEVTGGGEWVAPAVEGVLAAATPRECQVATGAKGGLIPPEVFAKEGVMEAWHAAGVEVMLRTLVTAARECPEFYERWRSLVSSVSRLAAAQQPRDVELETFVGVAFAEMREENPKDVWGSGKLLTPELEERMFEAAADNATSVFSPEAFVLEQGSTACNHYGKAATAFADVLTLVGDGNHLGFRERTADLALQFLPALLE